MVGRSRRCAPAAITFALGGAILAATLLPRAATTQSPALTYRAVAPLVASDAAAPEPTPTPPPGPEPQPSAPNSYDLINGALARGQISAEQAAIYRVFAAFADPRLPAAYQGPPGQELPDSVELFGDIDVLSPSAQAVIRPFTLRPDDPASWFHTTDAAPPGDPSALTGAGTGGGVSAAARPTGRWLSVTGTKVRVHYYDWGPAGPTSFYASRAAEIVDQVDNVIWQPKLVGLMGREPPPDCLLFCGDRGGDALYDIYLVTMNGAFLQPESPNDCTGPWTSYLLLSPTVSFAFLAHELMHAFQRAFPRAGGCREYDWLAEATANWANDFIYKKTYNTDEHKDLPEFLDHPRLPLEFKNTTHEYGAYLFFFYLTRVGGAADSVLRDMWAAAGSNSDSLEAVNGAIPGGFAKHWPEFIKYNWNPDPPWAPLDKYRALDEITLHAALQSGFAPKPVSANPDDQVELKNAELVHLSSAYYAFEFDHTVSTLAFLNGFTYELKIENDSAAQIFTQTELDATQPVKKHGRVQALIKRVGKDWEVADWSNTPSAIFCLDDPADRVERLVVILSNSDHDRNNLPIKPVNLSPRLWASNMGCYQWQGTATVSSDNENVTASATWERIPGSNVAGPLPGPGGVANRFGVAGLNYKLSAASVTWTGKCTHSFNLAQLTAAQHQFFTANFIPAGNLHRGYAGGGFTPPLRCSADEPPLPRAWLAMGPQSSQSVEVSADGKRMKGAVGGITWDFTAFRPP